MFHKIEEALEYIENKRTKRTFVEFLEIVKKYHFNTNQKNMIHIAGTNGKGSTTKLVSQFLMVHGYHVGTFTSPYIIKHNDRICIDDEPIDDETLLSIINELIPIIESEQLSMFEIDVLIMLKYFDQHDLDYRVIETGIGGREDKTNVIESTLSAITNIGYDHQFMLGDTLDKIAYHKAGIIKPNQIFITTETNEEILEIFMDECDAVNAFFYPLTIQEQFPKVYYDGNFYHLSHGGVYQVYNTTLALAIISNFIHVKPKLIQAVLDQFSMPGRFELFSVNHTNIYLDGAHNVSGIQALIDTLNYYQLQDARIIFSSLKEKETDKMLNLLKEYDCIQVSFYDERCKVNKGMKGYQEILNNSIGTTKNIIITGSLHFISEVRKYIKNQLLR